LCELIAGKIKCICDHGYTGETCSETIDKCKPNPCENSGTCHNLIDDYYCECLPEFGSSKNCSERFVDPCSSSPCYNNGACYPITSRSATIKNEVIYTNFTCKCLDHFKGDLCEIATDPCSSNPCGHRGRCILNINKSFDSKTIPEYSCKCYPAFTGRHCESYLDQCLSSPCKNNGNCLATPEGHICHCPYNYTGRKYVF
jgi:Notch-like protein